MNGAILATMLLATSPEMAVAQDIVPTPLEAAIASNYPPATRPYAPSMLLYYPAPDYDCYSHHRGRLDCYPCFQQRHFRRPYNYRVKFDYMWHEDVYRNFPEAVRLDDCPDMEATTYPLAAAPGYGQRAEARTRTPRRTFDAARGSDDRTALRPAR